MRERLKTELDLLVHAEGERDARFELADRSRPLLKTQSPQHRHHRRDKRLADDQVGPAAIVENGHRHALQREQRRQRRSRRAAADNADGSRCVSHGGHWFS